jgi:hypothetical protein
MSIDVGLQALAEALERFRLGYLVTTAEDGTAHVAPAQVTVDGAALLVAGAGARSLANAAVRRSVTLLWPPADPEGYSLIVDGLATSNVGQVADAPTRAVLHRAAPSAAPGDGACAADCVELPLPGAVVRRG